MRSTETETSREVQRYLQDPCNPFAFDSVQIGAGAETFDGTQTRTTENQ
jgi:hypothetical protein